MFPFSACGQAIYIDPTAEMVIVRMASHPVAANAANNAYSLPAYQAVAEYLMGKMGNDTAAGHDKIIKSTLTSLWRL